MIKWKNRSEFWITGAEIAAPGRKKPAPGCIHLKRGIIEELVWKKSVETDLPVLELDGYLLTPGFVDIHTHLREPGYEEKETIATGTSAAIAGGFTTVACMANTDPVVDDPSVVRYILDRNEQAGNCRLYVIAAVTRNLEGRDINEFGLLREAGAAALSDDGKYIANARVMRSALEYAGMLELPVISHCEEISLSAEGLMNEGYYSTKLGLAGIPAETEETAVYRDVALAGLTGSRLHVAHASTAGTVEIIRRAKERQIPVTAEVTPHHLTMDDSMLQDYDRNLKVNPPLRSREDVDIMLDALSSGVIDCISTDHAPHNEIDKEVEFDLAPPGMIGLQTAFALLNTELVETGKLGIAQLVALMTESPARVLGIPAGTLDKGAPADLAVIDPDEQWVYDRENNRSISSNSPLIGRKLTGRVQGVFVGGKWTSTV
ncbi:MAG: amidohydrolase family protein [Candidatus Latescibacteria bacterium]|nr:amidohydrolase family protein [bacterium]MBD3424140.1 amidohydrolase family protein [Candidatus Latescibacterota bacterium]